MSDTTDPAAEARGPLTADEWAALTASIEHLSGPDAWDEGQLEPALIPVTHYVPRLMAELERLRAEVAAVAADAKPGHAVFVRHQSIGALTGAVAICQQALDDLRAAGYGGLVDQYTATYAGQDDGGLSAAIEAVAKPEPNDGAR